jgi:hypothetical protein
MISKLSSDRTNFPNEVHPGRGMGIPEAPTLANIAAEELLARNRSDLCRVSTVCGRT